MGPFVRALWLVQRYGTADAVDPANDQRVKGALSKALGKDGELTLSRTGRIHGTRRHSRSSPGPTSGSDPEEIRTAVEAAVPESRKRLLPEVREHADRLTTSFDMIDEPHRLAGRKLADWIAENYRPGRPLDVIVVCTGNSRRSILGATMGNIAAAYYGMPEVRFHSGGTAPTAFNARTVGPQGDRRRDRADRQGGAPGRAEDRQPGLSRPLGFGRRIGRAAAGGDRVLQALRRPANPAARASPP